MMTPWYNLYDYTWSPSHLIYQTPYLTGDVARLQTATASAATFIVVNSYRSDYDLRIPYNAELSDIGQSYFDDLYNRIHIIPNHIDFSSLIGTQIKIIRVWNSYMFYRRLEFLELINGEGIGYSSGQTAPFNFSPLEEVSWTITGTQNGPAVIDANLAFDFDLDENISLPITGRRVLTWVWEADWSAGVLERLEWSTDVIENYDGSEQRRSLMAKPRRIMEFTPMAQNASRRTLESTLFGWGSRNFAVPVWPDVIKLDAIISQSVIIIHCNTIGRSFVADGFAVLHTEQTGTHEIVEILLVEDDKITLKRPTVNIWPAGTNLYPAFSMFLKDQPTFGRNTSATSIGKVVMQAEQPVTWSSTHGLPTYKGYPVYDFKVNWVKDPEFQFNRRISLFDNGTGVLFKEDEPEIPFPTYTMAYTQNGRSQVETWRRTLQHLRGRFNSIWVSTGASDLKMTSPMLSSSGVLVFELCGFNTYMYGQIGRTDIRIELTDGSVYYRRITASYLVDETTEMVYLDSALGVDAYPDTVAYISFMYLARLDADNVELAWWNGDVVNSVVTFKGFKHGV